MKILAAKRGFSKLVIQKMKDGSRELEDRLQGTKDNVHHGDTEARRHGENWVEEQSQKQNQKLRTAEDTEARLKTYSGE